MTHLNTLHTLHNPHSHRDPHRHTTAPGRVRGAHTMLLIERRVVDAIKRAGRGALHARPQRRVGRTRSVG